MPTSYPRYGNTVAGPPGEITWLRIAARVLGVADETYTAYTSLDGETGYRNGTWTHHLGSEREDRPGVHGPPRRRHRPRGPVPVPPCV